MSVPGKRIDSVFQMLLLDQDVIRFVRGNRKYRDAGICERFRQRRNNSWKAIIQWTFAFQDSPARLALDAIRKVRFRTNDRQLVRCPRNGDKLSIRGPGRHVRTCVEATDCVALGQYRQCEKRSRTHRPESIFLFAAECEFRAYLTSDLDPFPRSQA